MSKRVVSVIIVSTLACLLTMAFNFELAESLGSPATEWTRTYGGANLDTATSVVQTDDGGYMVAGATHSFGAGIDDFWLVKTDMNGNLEWSQTYGGTLDDWASSVIQMSDGGYALAGWTRSFGAGGSDFWLVKTDSNGILEWSQTYGGTLDDEGAEGSRSLLQTYDGGYVLTGYTSSFGAGSEDFWLIKTDAMGLLQWDETYGGGDVDKARSIIQTTDGGYAIAGRTDSFGAGGGDFWLIKLAGPPSPVGGIWVPIDTTELLAPWIGLASLITVATASIVYVIRRKKE